MDQAEFALFLEEHIIEMSAPTDEDRAAVDGLKPKFADPMDMLSLSRDLEIYSKESVRQALKLSSGERNLQFTTEHCDADGKPISIPDFFVVQMPLFDGGESHRILARLRYRKPESVWCGPMTSTVSTARWSKPLRLLARMSRKIPACRYSTARRSNSLAAQKAGKGVV